MNIVEVWCKIGQKYKLARKAKLKSFSRKFMHSDCIKGAAPLTFSPSPLAFFESSFMPV